MTWLFQPISGGSPVTVSATLTNINDQFSYVLRVACATEVPGYAVSSNTIRLSPSNITYNRSQVNWNGNALSFVEPSRINTTFTSTDRGRVERVDLDVSLPILDLDGNGLPDDWERLYFGRAGIDPSADSDGDSHKNLDEYQLNTNPTDSGSGLRFTEIAAVQGGIRLKWSSAPDRFYALQRSLFPTGPFADISTGIAATPGTNTVLDTSAMGGQRLLLSAPP